MRLFYAPPISLRRDTKVPAAPASSLAKAGSILTKAVGSFVGGSSGSTITQVLRTSNYCLPILKHWQVMCPLLEKGLFPPLCINPCFISCSCSGTLPDDWRVADPRDSRGGDFNGSRGNALPIGGAREVRLDAFDAACFILLDVFKMNSAGHRCRIGWRKLGGRSSGYAHAVGLCISSVLNLFIPNSHRTHP